MEERRFSAASGGKIDSGFSPRGRKGAKARHNSDANAALKRRSSTVVRAFVAAQGEVLTRFLPPCVVILLRAGPAISARREDFSRSRIFLYHRPRFLLECAVLWVARTDFRGSKIIAAFSGD